LVRKYPYDKFRREVLAYVQYEILGNTPLSSVSSCQQSPLAA
jgi:hypothetical protein